MASTEDKLPRLRPLFGAKPYGADTTCADVHPDGALPADSVCVCMVCSATGASVEARIRKLAQEEADRLRREREARLRDLRRRITEQRFASQRRRAGAGPIGLCLGLLLFGGGAGPVAGEDVYVQAERHRTVLAKIDEAIGVARRLTRTAPAAGPAPGGPALLRGPSGAYLFTAPGPGPIDIEVGPGVLRFSWDGGSTVVPIPDPVLPPPGPSPVPVPDPPAPVPPSKPVAWATLVYSVGAQTPGVAAVLSDRAVKAKVEAAGIRWIAVDAAARLPDGRSYLTATGLDRALDAAGIAPPCIVRQAADGSVLGVRAVPTDPAAAQALIDAFLAAGPP